MKNQRFIINTHTISLLILLGLALSSLSCCAVKSPAPALREISASALPEIIAHRGASRDAPENTLAAINLAWQQQADAVEIDIRLTGDGKIVLMHDDNTKRTASLDKLVVDQTLAELRTLDAGKFRGEKWAGTKIPTLEEALATLPPGKRMIVEIKTGPQILPELKRVIEASGKTPQQIAFISFSFNTCKEVKALMPQYEAYYLIQLKRDKETGEWKQSPDELIANAREARIDGLDVKHEGPIEELAAKTRAANLKLVVWTVDDPAVAKRMAEFGVDGITTNRPMDVRECLQQK